MKRDFTLDDLRESLRHLLQSWLSEFMTAGGNPEEISRFIDLVGAMSPEERADPDSMKPVRLKQLAATHALSEATVEAILERFKRMREMLRVHYDTSMRPICEWSNKVDESWDLG